MTYLEYSPVLAAFVLQCSAKKMLGVDLKLSGEYKEALFDGNELLRLGYTRINLNFFIPDEEIDYILSAIEFIANFGWMFLPHY